MSKQLIKIKTHEDFIRYVKNLPEPVIEDVAKRIADWIASGGKPEDAYIKQQYKYVENIINYYLTKKGGR